MRHKVIREMLQVDTTGGMRGRQGRADQLKRINSDDSQAVNASGGRSGPAVRLCSITGHREPVVTRPALPSLAFAQVKRRFPGIVCPPSAEPRTGNV
jgi:hypothetical protein